MTFASALRAVLARRCSAGRSRALIAALDFAPTTFRAPGRAARVVRLAECDPSDLESALAASDADERQDAATLLALSVALAQDERLIVKHRLAALASNFAEIAEAGE